MDPSGNPKKINRQVLKAVAFFNEKNKNSKFTNILEFVRICNKNCRPVADMKHSVTRALYNLEKCGLLIKKNTGYKLVDWNNLIKENPGKRNAIKSVVPQKRKLNAAKDGIKMYKSKKRVKFVMDCASLNPEVNDFGKLRTCEESNSNRMHYLGRKFSALRAPSEAFGTSSCESMKTINDPEIVKYELIPLEEDDEEMEDEEEYENEDDNEENKDESEDESEDENENDEETEEDEGEDGDEQEENKNEGKEEEEGKNENEDKNKDNGDEKTQNETVTQTNEDVDMEGNANKSENNEQNQENTQN